jgi:hypothetical protein
VPNRGEAKRFPPFTFSVTPPNARTFVIRLKTGTGYFLLSALGLPSERNVLSSLNSRAITPCDSIFPKGLCLFYTLTKQIIKKVWLTP